MTIKDSNTDVRNGAIAAINAMKVIEQIAESGNCDWTIDDCFKAQNIAISSALLAAGDITKRAQGVIAAMAEYIYMCNSAGAPNLEKWRPESAMTNNEKQANRQTFIDDDMALNIDLMNGNSHD